MSQWVQSTDLMLQPDVTLVERSAERPLHYVKSCLNVTSAERRLTGSTHMHFESWQWWTDSIRMSYHRDQPSQPSGIFKDVPQYDKTVKSGALLRDKRTLRLCKGMDRGFRRWDAQIIFSQNVPRWDTQVEFGALAISAPAELCTDWGFHSDPSASWCRALDPQLTLPELNKCQNKKLFTHFSSWCCSLE